MRRVLIAVGAFLLATGILACLLGSQWTIATKAWPVDFDINWVAAQRLVDREPIYDAQESRAQAIRDVNPSMRLTGHDPFSSYIGSPPVALSHAPFLLLDHDTAVQWWRFVQFLMMVVAILLTAWALAPPARAPAGLIGLGVFFWTFPMVKALSLGQGTGMVMCSLALGIWAASRERWGLAGIGLGLAAVLKVSPVLLVLYLVLRGHRRVLWTAMATAAVCFGAAAAIGRPGDLVVWLRDVSPSVSKGTISSYNQSLVGALSRLTTNHTDLSSRVGPGAWYLLAYLLWGAAVFGLWRHCRGRVLDPLELGVLVLVLLLAGPLTWDHYFAWAILPVVLLADPSRWEGRAPVEIASLSLALVMAGLLCRKGIPLPSPAAVRADWWMRVATDRYAAAALLVLFAATWVLVRAPARGSTGAPSLASDRASDEATARAEWADERRDDGAPVGTARGVVATGVHRRG